MDTPDTMATVVDRVAGLTQANSERRGAILDEVWRQVASEGDAGWG